MYFNAQILTITSLLTVENCLANEKGLVTTPEPHDFAEVVKSNFFVDKTFLIRDLLEELSGDFASKPPISRIISVLAGPHFGKSTNNNMIKRFLQINVDYYGKPTELKGSPNYRLFRERSLNIRKHDEMFDDHFGKYPVVSINFKSFSEVTSFVHLLEKYREVLWETYSEHKYLMNVEDIWTNHFNKSNVEMYFDREKNKNLHHYNIYCGFIVLVKVLRTYFEKRVFILMDDFNSIEDSPAYANNVDLKEIGNFILEVNNELLLANADVEGVLMVGSLYPSTPKYPMKLYKRKKFYKTDSTSLWKYYGISKSELKILLRKMITDPEDLEATAGTIIERFSGHNENRRSSLKRQPCSVWSVIQYFDKDRKNNEVVVKQHNFG